MTTLKPPNDPTLESTVNVSPLCPLVATSKDDTSAYRTTRVEGVNF